MDMEFDETDFPDVEVVGFWRGECEALPVPEVMVPSWRVFKALADGSAAEYSTPLCRGVARSLPAALISLGGEWAMALTLPTRVRFTFGRRVHRSCVRGLRHMYVHTSGTVRMILEPVDKQGW